MTFKEKQPIFNLETKLALAEQRNNNTKTGIGIERVKRELVSGLA
jgi:hypothetical protein